MEFEVFNRDKDIQQQRALFKECFPENNGTLVESEAHYLWKFHTFPATPNSYEYGAYLNKKLIGYYAALPFEYVISDKTIRVGMVCDVMTSVQARGKGIFTKLGIYSTESLKEEKLDFTLGYPIRTEVMPGHIKAGWEKLFPLPLFIKLLRSRNLLKHRRLIILYPVMDIILLIYNFLVKLLVNKGNYTIENIDSAEINKIKGLDLFLRNWISEQKIALNKNTEFLNWRLGGPQKEYRLIIARNLNEIVGFCIVTEIIRENVPSLAILDLSCLQEHGSSSGRILEEVESYARERNLDAIIIMASKHYSKKYHLARNGFLRSPYKFQLILKNLGNNYTMEFLRNEKHWHLTWIDSDDL